MENAKCKRRGVVKNKNYARKGGRKPQKSLKKTKGKESLQPSMRTRHKCDGRGVGGVFVRELCTQGFIKGSPSEAKETCKHEDVHKIIDLGKVFFQKGKLSIPPSRRWKGVSSCRDSWKPEKSCFAFGKSSTDSSQDIGRSLSHISPPRTPAEVTPMKECTAYAIPVARRKLNLEEELHAFSLKYEAVVGAQILCKLPENGVLEDALTALRKRQKTNRKDDPEREEPLLGSQVEFLRDDLEAEDYILRGNFLVPEEQFCESFMETPLENMFILNAPTVGNADHSPYLSVFDGDEGGSAAVECQSKDFQKTVKKLSIATPPIQFYRRNMF